MHKLDATVYFGNFLPMMRNSHLWFFSDFKGLSSSGFKVIIEYQQTVWCRSDDGVHVCAFAYMCVREREIGLKGCFVVNLT